MLLFDIDIVFLCERICTLSTLSGRQLINMIQLVDATEIFEFSLNVFTEFSEFRTKIFVITLKGLEPATQLPLV